MTDSPVFNSDNSTSPLTGLPQNDGLQDNALQNEKEILPSERPPDFGLVDVVDAFTAMRHEWRTQSKEGRQLAESVHAATDLLGRLDSTLEQKLATVMDDSQLKNILSIVIELDISLQRAVSAASLQASDMRRVEKLQHELTESVEQHYQNSGFLIRWLGKAFFRQVLHSVDAACGRNTDVSNKAEQDPTLEGLHMALGRLRRMMSEQNLQRLETLGKPFDGECMTAISTVESSQYAPGIVADEISPAYFYQSRLIRFAEVRVSGATSGDGVESGN